MLDKCTHIHTVTSTHTVFSPQILVEVKSLLIAFHAVDGWITALREEAWRCQNRKRRGPFSNLHTHTHTCMQTWYKQHTHIVTAYTFKACTPAQTHTHSLACMPANRDCYQLISASSCRGQPYWHCNDSFLVWVTPSLVQPCHSDSIINTQSWG